MNMKKNNTDKAFSKKLASDFSVSLDLDKRLYKEDIQLSIAYSKALKKIDILSSNEQRSICLLYTSPSPRDATLSRMPSSA